MTSQVEITEYCTLCNVLVHLHFTFVASKYENTVYFTLRDIKCRYGNLLLLQTFIFSFCVVVLYDFMRILYVLPFSVISNRSIY